MMREPNDSTLFAMFGSNEPIGSFATAAFDLDMARAKTMQEAARAVVLFAKSYHEAQASYEAISPYGGEDIEVIPAETLAYCKLDALFDHLSCAGIDKLSICRELYTQMEKNRIDTRETRGFIQEYEAKAHIADGHIPSAFREEVEQYEAATAWASHIIQQEFDAFQKEGEVLFQKASAELKRLERKGLGLYKRVFPEKYNAQKVILEKRRLAAAGRKRVTLDDMKRDNESPRYEEALEAVPLPPRLLDETVLSIEQLQAVIDRFYGEISAKKEREDYLKACTITGREPVPVPKREPAHLGRASIREAIQQAERSADTQEQRGLSRSSQEREY